jgi:hypothetical protein
MYRCRAHKGSFLGVASAQGIAILFPDTSPRGAGIEGEDNDWDFGTGAGFYLNATNPKYAKHYNMLTHVTMELPQVIEAAGIPIVSLDSLGHFPDHSCFRRTLNASLFLDIVWVAMELSPYTCPRRRSNTDQHLPLRRSQTPPNALGDKKPSMDICKGEWRRLHLSTTPLNSS